MTELARHPERKARFLAVRSRHRHVDPATIGLDACHTAPPHVPGDAHRRDATERLGWLDGAERDRHGARRRPRGAGRCSGGRDQHDPMGRQRHAHVERAPTLLDTSAPRTEPHTARRERSDAGLAGLEEQISVVVQRRPAGGNAGARGLMPNRPQDSRTPATLPCAAPRARSANRSPPSKSPESGFMYATP